MTGWKVERTLRTACRPGSIPAGGSSLMPPHSQGAERRPERRAGHTTRWALRALVVGGLAGVAWLLTGTAANAADHDGEPVGSPAGSTMEVASVYGDEPLVDELLKAAAQPLESGPEVHRRHVVTSILTTPERVLSESVAVLAEVGLGEKMRDGSAIGAEALGTEPWTSTVPLRTSGAEQDDRTRPESAEDAADPVAEPGTEFVPADFPPAVEPAVVQPVTSTVPTIKPVAGRPLAAERVRVVTRTTPPASAGDSTRAHRAAAGVTPVRHAKFRTHGHHKIGHRHVPAIRPVAPETVREEAPGDDGPAPRRMSRGAVSGIPAGGPGASADFGSTVVVPARIANGVVDDHRFPLASDVDVRRHDAGAPAVSPD